MSDRRKKEADNLREYVKTLNLTPEKEAIAEEWIHILTSPTVVTEDNEEGLEVLVCLCCEKKFYWDDGSWHKSKRICDDCAQALGNSWYKARSGEPHPLFCLDEEREAIRRRIESRRGYTEGKKNIPEELRWQVFERDGFKCRKCGASRLLRADHIHPESKGGEATLDNLQTLCMPCNSRKGPRLEVAA